MSSPPSDKRPDEEPRDDLESSERGRPSEVGDRSAFTKWWDRVEPWRRLMLGGALILLSASIARAGLKGGFPDSATFVANFGGYLLFALGFARFFRDRRKKK
ncbi:MAG: hypothetical protein ACRDJ2_00190 [Actinomycetota bacterium]